MSDSPFHRVGLVSKPGIADAAPELEALVRFLDERQLQVCFDGETAALLGATERGVGREELAETVDLLVVLGGDGTLLSIARSAAAADCPVFGVNYGGLGFLTSTTRDELLEATGHILAGSYTVSVRQMLRATLASTDGGARVEHDVLNDVVITGTDLARIVDLSARIDDDLVSEFRADGLIVCTATGSTAYSLAAGGPIVMPEVDAIVLTPISPHTLTNRPLVIPADAAIEIRQESKDQEVILTLDGQAGFVLRPGETVTVRRAPKSLHLLHPLPRSYFDVLRAKLQWGQR